MSEIKLPADPGSLILGIVALVIGIAGCCCYGILAIVPLTLSIIGLVMANRSIKLYNENSSEYSASSRSNVGVARIINIISIVFNGLIVLFFIAAFVMYGTFVSKAIMEGLEEGRFETADDWVNDGMYDDDVYEMEVDTTGVDSIYIEELPVNDTIEN